MPSPPATSLNPFRVLVRHRNFRIFWTGQTLSLVGTWMQQMASGWLALELTDDPLLVDPRRYLDVGRDAIADEVARLVEVLGGARRPWTL